MFRLEHHSFAERCCSAMMLFSVLLSSVARDERRDETLRRWQWSNLHHVKAFYVRFSQRAGRSASLSTPGALVVVFVEPRGGESPRARAKAARWMSGV
jgi:hypothetical protein